MPRRRERRIPAGRFKATCLALLDDVAATRRGFIVTKRGRPVARVAPVDDEAPDLAGSVVFEHDIVAPVDEAWDAER
jgi:prevent-host-death family protein